MSRTTTVIVFLSLSVAVAALDFKFNDYDEYSQNLKENAAANVLNSTLEGESPAPNISAESKHDPSASAVESQPPGPEASDAGSRDNSGVYLASAQASPQTSFLTEQIIITTQKLTEAGFNNVELKQSNFVGILFEKVDLRDFKSIEVIQQRSIDQSVPLAFYEFHAHDPLLSQEIYVFIKQKAQDTLEHTVNETNDFGDNSFYLNDSRESGFVFLVVKTGESVYAMSYQKELHDSIKNLLRLLY